MDCIWYPREYRLDHMACLYGEGIKGETGSSQYSGYGACSAYGETFKEAWEHAYVGVSAVKFEDCFYRKDIGLPGAAESGKL